MMIKSAVLDRTGLLDAGYFFGHEDIDFCLKAGRNGFKVVYAPGARIWHKVGGSNYLADPAPYYRLIKRNFSKAVYFYHLVTLPLLFAHQVIIYSTKFRDKQTLGKVFSYFAGFVLGKRR